MNPSINISSRYSLANISASTYQNFLTGTTTQIGNKGSLEQGYVYAPYIIVQGSPIIIDGNWRERQRQQLRDERKAKLEKIYNKK